MPAAGVPSEPGTVAARLEAPTAAPQLAESASLTPPIGLQAYVTAMLDLLRPVLPANVAGLPPNSLTLATMGYRSLGIGSRRGLSTLDGMDVAELKGGWLDATVRFDLWAMDLPAIVQQVTTLQQALTSNGLELRQGGILEIKLTGTGDPSTGAVAASRKTLDYTILYEYHFEDTDGAASLIARIPINPRTDAAPDAQTVVRDWMVRWDSAGALDLLIPGPAHGSLTVQALEVAAYLPGGGPPGQVTQSVTRPSGTVTTTFGSLTALLASVELARSPLNLVYPPLPLQPGEVREIHPFQVGRLRFDPVIVLEGGSDAFRVTFAAPAFPAGDASQVYLRALP